jgi:hypothetical protein
MTNHWKMFLAYAKAHPDRIPRNAKQRSEVYKRIQDECKCGGKDPLCSVMGISAINKKLSIKNDTTILKAQIRAAEEEITRLRAMVSKRSKSAKSV